MDIYKDIENRTNGEIYIGVVGPVRTGKSTFIKRFMEMLVIPAIEDSAAKDRARDELPQSGTGKTIMTTEPKFIPKDGVEIVVNNGVRLKVRMIDCVGYMVEGAEGHFEDGRERLVKTPWFDYDIPFTKAAMIGTRKVIHDHSTVGIVVTSDGTVTDIDREAYISPEESTISELRELGKPYVIILNTRKPGSKETLMLAEELSAKYGADVIPVNCDQLKSNDINTIFEKLLLDFPIVAVYFDIPKWIEALEGDNEIKAYLIDMAQEMFGDMNKMRDIYSKEFNSDNYIEEITLDSIDMSEGTVGIKMKLFDKFYFDMISDMLGEEIHNEYQFITEIKNMAKSRKQCDRVKDALIKSQKTGYGAVAPEKEDIKLEPPELIKSGNKYGVKIKAKAPSIHLIKANISTEIAPIVGSEDQAKDLIKYINDGVDNDGIWDVNIFGKTVAQLVDEGLTQKVNVINQESQQKLQDTMEKIVNESNGGMVCIII